MKIEQTKTGYTVQDEPTDAPAEDPEFVAWVGDMFSIAKEAGYATPEERVAVVSEVMELMTLLARAADEDPEGLREILKDPPPECTAAAGPVRNIAESLIAGGSRTET